MQTGRLGTVGTVVLDGVTAHQVDAVVLPSQQENDDGRIDGLLGLSFLSRFKIDVDHRKGQLTLEAL